MGAVAGASRWGCVPRPFDSGTRRWVELPGYRTETRCQRAYGVQVEKPIRTSRNGRVAGTQPGKPTSDGDTSATGENHPPCTTETVRWQHALVLPQIGGTVRDQQDHGTESVGASQATTASAGSLHGQQ